ncbi:fatty acid hydroxylase domain-containing protein 2 [Daphnia magna]|uniref:fatty acid hydroxylase domain-containing protein 2 n=1 Tax=Daphnia magna TaxID=35525 RepID=UPI001E1BAE71|nr:fatty acid hydroxylase domain-containing protein 2 [Daphnia magna]XP_045032889.1 fatty acid hydroxylase domain-containing protein 2 [Daphnia magna]XP_045032890.1 fatty acid hydroxylase domain-containing protein 2 [Daphnia magna]XP_045032891.1 fatty acid hydroxylase domain-containing protein 2 [Daphnia magna]
MKWDWRNGTGEMGLKISTSRIAAAAEVTTSFWEVQTVYWNFSSFIMKLMRQCGGWLGQLLVACILFFIIVVNGQTFVTRLLQARTLVGMALNSYWKSILNFFGNNDYYLYVWGCILCIQVPFWSVGGMFMFMDYFNWPKWTRKYKIQPGINEPIDLNKLIETVKVVLINQWAIANPLLLVSYLLKKMTNTMPGIYELPTLERFLIEMTVLFIVDEIALYYVHRIMHHPKLYARVHKKHHEWHAPIAISVVYTTKIENLMITAGTALGPFLMNPHLITLYVWYTLVHLRGLKNHCGYHFPWLPTPEDHDYHHMMSNACFGRTLALDWLHGTDKGYHAYRARKKALHEQNSAELVNNKSE